MREIVVWFDMDDTLAYYTKAKNAALVSNPGIKYPQSQLDFFRNLEPIRFAVEAFIILANDPRFYVGIATAPSEQNPLSYMEKRIWVEQNLGVRFVSHLYIVPEKHRLIGDVLIDDVVTGRRKQDRFNGKVYQVSPNTPRIEWTYLLAECDKLARNAQET